MGAPSPTPAFSPTPGYSPGYPPAGPPPPYTEGIQLESAQDFGGASPAGNFGHMAGYPKSPMPAMPNPAHLGSMLQQPVVQDMALQYGNQLASQGREAVQRELNKYVPVSRLRYYFAVDTRYVTRKLLLIMFPYTHKEWMVKYDQDTPVQPRYDLNAPDLYIPSMGYVTYVLLAGFVLGLQQSFSPEQIGMQASSALAYIIFEMIMYLVIKMLVLVVALFALCWLPLQSYLLLQSFFPSINEYKYINVLFFCFDWLAMSNSCYNPFIYAIYNEKFKKEFKQRFTFGKKTSRFVNDSYEDGQSYRTRILSFRSTNDRSGYSTRKSLNLPSGDTLKVPSRNSCHCMGGQSRETGFNFMKTEDLDGHSSSRRYLNLKMSNTDMGKRRLAKKLSNRDDMPIGDERVSELYIFPNSNIVEFTDISYDDKV